MCVTFNCPTPTQICITDIKSTSHDVKQYRSTLKKILLINSFYSEEYFTWNSNRDIGPV